MLVGTYNSPASEGIYVYKFNSDSGTTRPVSMIKTSNPSYLAVSPDNKYVYAVGEVAGPTGREGAVSSFAFNKSTGALTLLSTQSSGGNNPCYIATDKKGKWAMVGNYSSGNLSVLRVRKGKLLPALQVIQHEGSGPDTSRQESPHVHGVFPDKKNQYVYFTDLGIDKVMAYYQSKAGRLTSSVSKTITMPPGSGPRHLDFHPGGKYMYVLNELSNSVSVLKDTGNSSFTEIQNLSALPPYFKGKSTAADIHVSPDGKFLYTSNRGTNNTIAVFSIDPQSGMINSVNYTYTEGETPRNFNFDPTGNYLIVGNQNSNTIVIFKRNKETGLLTDTGQRIPVGKPVCIKWMPSD
jgi:6-phosphogluconolactonase